jgi:hypothetical protein
MTEAERIDRQTLLRRAARAAGAVYLAPVLTSAASAGTYRPVCGRTKCKNATKQAKCRARGGGCACDCQIGARCGPAERCECGDACGCDPNTCCNVLIPCNGCNGNGACFCDAKNPIACTCVDLRDGFCSSFQPCDQNNFCPAGQCCFNSCCGQPLCSDHCSGSGTGRSSVRKGGAGMLFR